MVASTKYYADLLSQLTIQVSQVRPPPIASDGSWWGPSPSMSGTSKRLLATGPRSISFEGLLAKAAGRQRTFKPS